MSGILGGIPTSTPTPAPPAPTRSEAERANLAAEQRNRIRRAIGRDGSRVAETGTVGAANAATVSLLGGTR